jgi:hypothetical protein
MPKKSGEKRDFMQVAREIVEQAIGEKMDGAPLDQLIDPRNPHAVALGRAGGKKGGTARAKALSPEKLCKIARVGLAIACRSPQMGTGLIADEAATLVKKIDSEFVTIKDSDKCSDTIEVTVPLSVMAAHAVA